MTTPRAWPDDPDLLPIAPLVYVAWADGTLSAGQLESIRDRLTKIETFDDGRRAVIQEWLDPERPPAVVALEQLLVRVRESGRQLNVHERRSLADLGMALVADSSGGDAGRQATRQALAEIEHALGLVGVEESRDLLVQQTESPPLAAVPREATFDVSALRAWLDEPHGNVREQLKRLLSRSEFVYPVEPSTSEYRQLVLDWTRLLAREGYGSLGLPKEFGGAGNFGAFIAAFETLAFHDLSLTVKFGVQFGLFGGSIMFLGTRWHHEKYLRDVGSLALPGCFAMSELGHGSNVWDLETTATYAPATQSFTIHTPTETARKEWIGNAAQHGRLATVFAQLRVGDESYGVHAFVVPIRDGAGDPMPGVRIEDCGQKEGLNGVDNGRLWFDHVVIPRENLLNRYADVAPDGTYDSPIVSPSRRFFTMLGTLVGGRVSIAAASLSAAKSALAIAVRYSEHRRQFGPAGGREWSILDYLTQQRRLLPRVATVFGIHFAVRQLALAFVARTEDTARHVETQAAAMKSYASWFAIDTLQACREACGGQGYLAVNRIPALKADVDIFATFEGDNTVLMQLVAKGLLTNFKHQFGELRPWGVVKFLAERVAATAVTFNPIWTRLTDENHLRDADFLTSAFRYREERLLHSLARRLKSRVDDGMDSFDAFVECQDHAVILANAYAERVILDAFRTSVERCPVDTARSSLIALRDLYALSRLEADRGWFLECGYFEGAKARAIRALVTQLSKEVRTSAAILVEAFGIPDQLVGAPIASSIDPRTT